MRMRSPDFSNQQRNNEECYYDLIGDYELIESSFAQQYGIRLRKEYDMSWGEFISLLSGISYETPLGHVIAIRSETDEERIKNFSKNEKRIYEEWQEHMFANMTQEQYEEKLREFENRLLGLAQ